MSARPPSRLPMRYVLATWVAGLVTCAGVGAWLAFTTPIPIVWSIGAVVGVLLGAVGTATFVHLLQDRSSVT